MANKRSNKGRYAVRTIYFVYPERLPPSLSRFSNAPRSPNITDCPAISSRTLWPIAVEGRQQQRSYDTVREHPLAAELLALTFEHSALSSNPFAPGFSFRHYKLGGGQRRHEMRPPLSAEASKTGTNDAKVLKANVSHPGQIMIYLSINSTAYLQ